MISVLKSRLLQAVNDRVFRLQLVKYVMLGATRTVLGYLLYLLLLQIMPYWAAFTVCYVATLLFSFFVNSNYVFRTVLTARKAVRYGAIYCINYVLGLGLLTFAIAVLGLSARVSPAFVIVIMFPVGFLAERYALTR